MSKLNKSKNNLGQAIQKLYYDHTGRTFKEHLPLCSPVLSQLIAETQPIYCFRKKIKS